MPDWKWAALLALGAVPPIDAAPADQMKIIELQQNQAAAWNAHDIESYSSLYTAEADVVNVLGWHWRSRSELREKLGRAFASVFRNSRMTIRGVSVKFLQPDVAVAHVNWTMTGALSPTGTGGEVPEQGIQTQVLVRRGGHWLIAAFQNTNSIPEKPFPPAR